MTDLLLTNGTDYLLLQDSIHLLRLVNTIYTVSMTESSIAVTDSISRTHIYVRKIVEGFGRLQLVTGFFLLLTDGFSKILLNGTAINVTDSLASQQQLKRTITESNLPVTDSISRKQTIKRAITETGLTITDSLAKSAKYVRLLVEGSGRLMLQTGFFLLFTDGVSKLLLNGTAIPVTDTLVRSSAILRHITESAISITDSITIHKQIIRSISEGGNIITDSLSRFIIYTRHLLESNLPVTDSLSRKQVIKRAITESAIVITDSLRRFTKFIRSLTESAISITDSLASSFLRPRGLKIQVDFKNPKEPHDIDFKNPKELHYVDFSRE